MTLVFQRQCYNRVNRVLLEKLISKPNPLWDGDAINMSMLLEPEPKVITFETEEKQRGGFRDKFGSIMFPKRDVEEYAYRGIKPYMHMSTEEPLVPRRLNKVTFFMFLTYELAKNQKQFIDSLRQATMYHMYN